MSSHYVLEDDLGLLLGTLTCDPPISTSQMHVFTTCACLAFNFSLCIYLRQGPTKHRLELTRSFCVCIHVHTRKPEEEVQCSTLSLCFVPLKIGSFTESEAMLVATSPKQSSCLYLHLAAIIDSCKPPIVGPHNCWTIFLAPKFIKYFLVQNENHQKKCMLHYVYLIYSCF